MKNILLETDEYLLYLDRLAGVVKDPPDSQAEPGDPRKFTVVIGDARFPLGERESEEFRRYLNEHYQVRRLADGPGPRPPPPRVSHGHVEP